MDIKARKATIRREVLARILAMDPVSRLAQQAALFHRFGGLPGFADVRTVLLYASAFAEEVDTGPMLRLALDLGKRLILPTVDRPARRLRLFEVAEPRRELVRGLKGIPEPAPGCREVDPTAVDWVLVPGLAFDDRCHRLGRGAGLYDRLLPRLRPDVPTWALLFDSQWVEGLPVEPHDREIEGAADHIRVVRRTGNFA